MAATATKPLTPAPQPATPLERLHAERASLARELDGLNAGVARLRETANAEAAVRAELDELGRIETGAMLKWATEGCHGEAPRSDQQTRIRLAQKLNAAQAAAAAAKGAGADIHQKIAALNDRLRSISAQIEQAIFDKMETEHGHVITQYRANCEQGSKLAAQIHGLASFYGDAGRTLISRGDQDAGTMYLQRASALTNIKLPNPGVNRHEIEAAASNWGRRAAALRSGK
ncbi:hypothetical protein [Bradyrhizobium erythrophlei]|uniref:Uncharacterized protein n=1 Tax=Bradyrhizobium erythrophlei TaxID=1437360 RepID=A0A1M7UVD8_9BRAD|nr:hypothetical protein [Bradyrhizobium erythrophlei]SHN86924.1 hypothetical protein SAMN05444170_6920 [Bradyrhizobium erythrophlei]